MHDMNVVKTIQRNNNDQRSCKLVYTILKITTGDGFVRRERIVEYTVSNIMLGSCWRYLRKGTDTFLDIRSDILILILFQKQLGNNYHLNGNKSFSRKLAGILGWLRWFLPQYTQLAIL